MTRSRLLGFEGTRYTYTASLGEVNDLKVAYCPGDGVMYFDDRLQVLPTGPCRATANNPNLRISSRKRLR